MSLSQEVFKEINKASFLAMMAEETMDVSAKFQLRQLNLFSNVIHVLLVLLFSYNISATYRGKKFHLLVLFVQHIQ